MLQVHDLVDEPSPGATDHVIARGPRSARSVLRLLALLARNDGPLRADEAAAALGRSLSATYELLDALCAEGFAVHARGGFLLADPGRAAALAQQQPQGAPPASLSAAVTELHERTGKRAYLATARSGQVVISITHGRQGVPRIPGLGTEIGDDAHALALGKIALSLLPDRGQERYIARGLKRFTAATIVDPEALRTQLRAVRRTGLAHDREEYHADFCCLAVGVQDGRRRTVAALGISMTAHAYDAERDALVPTLRDVAARAIPALPEKPAVS
jgi:DNA-binding IclR family transcriptional regulator